MAYQLAMHRAYTASHAFPAAWTRRPSRLTVRCHVNLIVAQTQRLNDHLKTDAAHGILVAVVLSAGLWAALGLAIAGF